MIKLRFYFLILKKKQVENIHIEVITDNKYPLLNAHNFIPLRLKNDWYFLHQSFIISPN